MISLSQMIGNGCDQVLDHADLNNLKVCALGPPLMALINSQKSPIFEPNSNMLNIIQMTPNSECRQVFIIKIDCKAEHVAEKTIS